MSAFFGMRGSGDFGADERPKGYREGVLYLEPNGDAPLLAMSSKGRSRKVNDPEQSYFTELQQTQAAAIRAITTEAGAATNSSTTGAVGATFKLVMAEASTAPIRPGLTAKLLDASDPTKSAFGKIISVVKNGASSYVTFKLKVAATAGNLETVVMDYLQLMGDANPEGSYIGDALSYDPDKKSQYTQIFRTPVDITRTARLTKLRTGDPYQRAKAQAMLYHSVLQEHSWYFGEKTELVGDNGKPERTCQGFESFIDEFQPDNIVAYDQDSSLPWMQGGEDWLDEILEKLFRYGRQTKLGLCGSGALLAINKIVKANTMQSLTRKDIGYGIQVREWTTPFGTLMLKAAPLLTRNEARRNSIYVLEPEEIEFIYMTDTTFQTNQGKGGRLGYDGDLDEFLTEGAPLWGMPYGKGILHNIGVDPA